LLDGTIPQGLDGRPAAADNFGDWRNTESREAAVLDAAFRALSDPTRREVLRLLRQRDMTAGEIADRFPLAKSTLSGHFNVLKQAGLIIAERQGSTVVYSLNTSALEDAMAAIISLFRRREGKGVRR
jgi:ArsR family transcriptional regulator